MNLDALPGLLGQQIALSEWVPITQERVQAFADATGDQQFIHVDPVRAAAGPFGAPIAHGFLTLSLLAGELANAGGNVRVDGGQLTVNYGLNRVRFVAPVRVGSRIRNRAVLQALEEGQGADGQRYVQLTVLNTIEIEGQDKPACVAESLFRVYLYDSKAKSVATTPKNEHLCKCGCGERTRGNRVFINKEHQLKWMNEGGASLLNSLMPDSARQLGGHISGQRSRDSGALAEAAIKGGAESHRIAERERKKRQSKK